VIFGLGKGGRSYYGIDVRDPANPTFQEANATY
jgi:Tfp pilus tip-associated adhesin PilY1